MGSACIHLNGANAGDSSTIIVSGAARSGTSMVAAALDAAGLWLGDQLDGICFEDADIAYAAERRLTFYRRAGRLAFAPRHCRATMRGFDVQALEAAIARRNSAHASWGFKRPNVLQRLRRDGISLFRQPRAIVCLRDPVALAQRSMVAEGLSLAGAMRNARRQVDEAMAVAQTIDCPALLVSFEKVKVDRTAFLAELFAFCGLDVARERYPLILDAIARAGERYDRIAAAPAAGFLDKPLGWSLSGWCASRSDAGAVEIRADGAKLVTARADRYRPDLVAAGRGSPYRGFRVDLRGFDLRGTEVIDVLVSGTGTTLHDSGYRLAPL